MFTQSNILEKTLPDSGKLRILALNTRLVRIQLFPPGRECCNNGLNRYGFIEEASVSSAGLKTTVQDRGAAGFVMETDELSIEGIGNHEQLMIRDRKSGRILLEQLTARFGTTHAQAQFKAEPEENWVGFGDQTRERLYHRGQIVDCQVRNVASYIPVPFFMSTRGIGVLVNTTHRVRFDMAKSDEGIFHWADRRGVIDYYVMFGKDFRELLNQYTALTGRPKLPPEWAFGLWYICRTQANDYEAVNDAAAFRREEIPCDVIGLEPGWMEKNYDLTTEKQWNQQRFPIPNYCFKGPHNFFNAIKRMGFKMELWLCNEYDLSYEAERQAKTADQTRKEAGDAAVFQDTAEFDTHFSFPRYADQITRKEEPWFEHLKKFVDQGVDFFKQDGAYQVSEHPDRIWGNGMLDSEMHNLYPLLYARQMYEGFVQHTNRRPVVFTPSGWTGFQAWCGTWTGDTGGRIETLGAMLNTAMVGHSWCTNDMEVTQPEGIHFGYLQPWSQINSWTYFRMPWLQGRELSEMHRYYSRFRSRLIPYIYSWAWQATRTGYPLMIPLALEFFDDLHCRANLHQYLLGRDLLVTIYRREGYFPAGAWKDFWTGEVIEGNQERSLAWPPDRGGGLFVRAGAIIPLGPVMQYRGEKPVSEIELYVFPCTTPSTFSYYEDDGFSLKHLQEEYAVTEIRQVRTKEGVTIEIGKVQGDFPGRVKNRVWNLTVALEQPPHLVSTGDRQLDPSVWQWDDQRQELHIQNIMAPGVTQLVL